MKKDECVFCKRDLSYYYANDNYYVLPEAEGRNERDYFICGSCYDSLEVGKE